MAPSPASSTPVEPTCLPPDPQPKTPELRLPPLSCDAHCHVFGPASVFPYAESRTFTPPDAPKEALHRLHRQLGVDRAVIVQASCHGLDHSALLDALESGQGRYRGVALVSPSTVPTEMARLHAAGVRGVRFNFVSHLGGPPPAETILDTLRLVAPFGWSVAIHITGKDLLRHIDLIRAIEAPVVIDHMARVDAGEGADGEAFTQLRRLVGNGKTWVKLSGVDRVSRLPPPFPDGVRLARILAEDAPERILWGTDWPHPNVQRHMPNDGELVDLIAEIAPSSELRRRMLVDNPARLFGFDAEPSV